MDMTKKLSDVLRLNLAPKATSVSYAIMIDGEIVAADALGCRCGSCFHVIWNQERELAGLDQDMSEDTSAAVRVAVDALRRIITQDRARAKK